MKETFIVVEVFQNAHDAHLFKTQLEAGGIEAFVDFDNSAGSGFLESAGTSGVQVRIHQHNLEKAQQLFKNFNETNQDYLDHLKGEDISLNGKKYTPWSGYCPNCDFGKIYMRKGSLLRTILAILTLGAATILFFGFRTKLCTNCDHEWKD